MGLNCSKYSKVGKYFVIPNSNILSLSPHLKCLSPHEAIGDIDFVATRLDNAG